MHFPKTPYPRMNQKFLPLQIILEENKLPQRPSYTFLHFKEAASLGLRSPKSKDVLNKIVKDYYNLSSNSSLGRTLIPSSIIANKRKTTHFRI